jgi:hypothetical protein
MNGSQTYDVVSVNIETNEIQIIAQNKTEKWEPPKPKSGLTRKQWKARKRRNKISKASRRANR